MMPHQSIALVTGASRGIGATISDTLAQNNIITIGTATSSKGAIDIQKRLQQFNPKNLGISLDVTDQNSIQQCFEEIQKSLDTPLILINNAGITRDNLMLRMDYDQWQAVIDANLSSAYRLIKACLRGMLKARQGCIINIGSVVAATGNTGQANYAAAKAGLTGLTRSLARELGNRNIRINCIAPGFIETDMTQALTDNQRHLLQQQIPLNRLGKSQDIADAVLFLVQHGDYITGQTLHINGGMFVT